MKTYSIKTYKKRNDEVIFYINSFDTKNGARVSLAMSNDLKTTKMSQGQKKLFDLFFKAFENVKKPLKIKSEHVEPRFNNWNNLELAITDIAELYGNKIGEDGAFLIEKTATGAFYANLREIEEELNILE